MFPFNLTFPEVVVAKFLKYFFLTISINNIWSSVHCFLNRFDQLNIKIRIFPRGPRYFATNRKVAGSIPGGVSRFFIDIKSFQSRYGPGVDLASNRNEYQVYFLGVKAAGA